jgi:hypothetical protein
MIAKTLKNPHDGRCVIADYHDGKYVRVLAFCSVADTLPEIEWKKSPRHDGLGFGVVDLFCTAKKA